MKKRKNNTQKKRNLPQTKRIGAINISKHLSMLVLDRNLSALVPEAQAYQDFLKDNSEEEINNQIDNVRYDTALEDIGIPMVSSIEDDSGSTEEKDEYRGKNKNNDEVAEKGEREESAYQILARQEGWKEIVTKSEVELPELEGAKAIEARIWWVKAQLELALMPISILAAPLEDLSDDIEKMKEEVPREVLKLSEDVLLAVAKKLGDSADFDVANSFLEKAYHINSDNIQTYLDGLKKEADYLAQQVQIPPTKKKISKLKEKIKDLEEIQKEIPQNSENKHYEEILNVALKEQTPPNKSKSSWSGFISVLVITAVVFMGREIADYLGENVGRIISPNVSTENKFFAEELVDYSEEAPAITLVSLQPLVVDSSRDIFSGLLEKMDNNSKADNAKPADNTNYGNISVSSYNLPELNVSQHPVEYVNTSGPLEPLEIAEMVEKEVVIPSENKEEEMDRVHKPIVGGFSRTDAIVPAYMIPLKEGESDGKMYLINEYANVYQFPRENSAVVAALVTGDKIKVVKIKNGWAEINSQQGRPGYIKAEALGSKTINLEDIPPKFNQTQTK